MYGLVPFRWNPAKRTKSFFDSLFDEDFFEDFLPVRISRTFCTDIKETDNAYIVEAELPGFRKDDIQVEITDNSLVICAERSEEKNEEGKGYVRRERMFGRFERRFYIENVKPEEATAKYENGILKIVLPKRTPSQNGRKIEIK